MMTWNMHDWECALLSEQRKALRAQPFCSGRTRELRAVHIVLL